MIKKLSELDEFFANMRLEDGISISIPSHQIIEATMSNPPLDNHQTEVREPTRQNLRKNHLDSQIISGPTERLQTRFSLWL